MVLSRQQWTRATILRAALLLALSLIAFAPVILGGGFFWDDNDLLIAKNPLIHSASGLFDFWFSRKNIDYFPLTMSTFWIEWRLWGAWAPPYHLLNALLHGGSGILLWRVLLRLDVPGAFFAALLFVIHPVNAESVAWISERKNTLSMFFVLASLLVYLQARAENRIPFHVTAVLLFLLALCAKTAVVMFPFVLLILAWRQSGKISWKDLLHSIPFFASSLVLGLVTMYFQRFKSIGEFIIREDGFASRLATAGSAIWFYLYKLLLPINIIFNYPRWNIGTPTVLDFLPLAALIALFVLLYCLRKTPARHLLAALAIYVLLLLPMLGFINIFFMRYSLVSDHWQYHATAAMLACVCGAVAGFYQRVGGKGAGGTWAMRRRVMGTFGAVIGAVLFGYTTAIATTYRTPESIWQNTLAHNPNSWLAHSQLGKEYQDSGRFEEAAGHFRDAARLAPDVLENQENLGTALLFSGQTDAALVTLQAVKEKNPQRATIYNDLGLAYAAKKDPQQAAALYSQAIALDPQYVAAHFNFGNLLAATGQFDLAVKEFTAALALQPESADAAFRLASCLAEAGKIREAIPYFELAVKLRPDMPNAQASLARARAAAGGR